MFKPLSVMLPALFAKLSTCVNPFINILSQSLIRMDIYRRLQLMSAPLITNPSGSAGEYNNSPYYDFGFSDAQQRQPITGWQRPTITQSIFTAFNDIIINHNESAANKTDDPEITVDNEKHEVEIWQLRHHHYQPMLDSRDYNWSPSIYDLSVQDCNHQMMMEGESYYYYYETTV